MSVKSIEVRGLMSEISDFVTTSICWQATPTPTHPPIFPSFLLTHTPPCLTYFRRLRQSWWKRELTTTLNEQTNQLLHRHDRQTSCPGMFLQRFSSLTWFSIEVSNSLTLFFAWMESPLPVFNQPEAIHGEQEQISSCPLFRSIQFVANSNWILIVTVELLLMTFKGFQSSQEDFKKLGEVSAERAWAVFKHGLIDDIPT